MSKCLRTFEDGAQTHESVKSVVGPALAVALEVHLKQGVVGRPDESVAAEQPVLAKLVIAQAESVGAEMGIELRGQRGGRAQ